MLSFLDQYGIYIFAAVFLIFLLPWLLYANRCQHIEKIKDGCKQLLSYESGKTHVSDLFQTLGFQSSFIFPTAETAGLYFAKVFPVLLDQHQLTFDFQEDLLCFNGVREWKKVGNILYHWRGLSKTELKLEDAISLLERVRGSIGDLPPSDYRWLLHAYLCYIQGLYLAKSNEQNPRKQKLEKAIESFGQAMRCRSLQALALEQIAGAQKFVEGEKKPESELKVTA